MTLETLCFRRKPAQVTAAALEATVIGVPVRATLVSVISDGRIHLCLSVVKSTIRVSYLIELRLLILPINRFVARNELAS